MFLALFSLIAWIFIIFFFLIKKSLTRIENIIVFFCLSLAILNLFTILTLNMRVIQNSNTPELYFCILIHRNIILPLGLLIYVNLIIPKGKFKDISIFVCTFLALFFIELLLKHLGIKVYISWSILYTGITMFMLIILSNLLAKLVKSIS